MLLNKAPPDKKLTISHTGRGPNRNTHALAATATAFNASATPLPAGSTDPSIGSSATAHRVKQRPDQQPRTPNRRSQPRTVSFATPNRTAIGRCPSPATFATIAAPITSTTNRRRARHTAGNSTCVALHP